MLPLAVGRRMYLVELMWLGLAGGWKTRLETRPPIALAGWLDPIDPTDGGMRVLLLLLLDRQNSPGACSCVCMCGNGWMGGWSAIVSDETRNMGARGSLRSSASSATQAKHALVVLCLVAPPQTCLLTAQTSESEFVALSHDRLLNQILSPPSQHPKGTAGRRHGGRIESPAVAAKQRASDAEEGLG